MQCSEGALHCTALAHAYPQANIAELVELVAEVWRAYGAVALDVHTDTPVMLLESWCFTTRELVQCSKVDAKNIIRYLLCSLYLLRMVKKSVNSTGAAHFSHF